MISEQLVERFALRVDGKMIKEAGNAAESAQLQSEKQHSSEKIIYVEDFLNLRERVQRSLEV